MVNYLFIHPEFGGQFCHMVRKLAVDTHNNVTFLCRKRDDKPLGIVGADIPNVKTLRYEIDDAATEGVHRYAERFEQDVKRGIGIYQICKQLKEQGYVPDIIVCHPSWGAALYLKDVYADVPLVCYAENFAGDVKNVYDARMGVTEDVILAAHSRNATNLLSVTHADAVLCPTEWQKSQFPKEFHHKITVIHDGIDTEACKPSEKKPHLKISDALTLTPEDEIVTYVTRGFDPTRGFSTFIAAAERILAQRPHCHIIVIGGGAQGYAKTMINFDEAIKDFTPDMKARLHRLGRLDYAVYKQIMQLSKAHIYLTVPSILSWSLLEIMAMEKVIVASNTPPVQEVIQDGVNGLLVDFFDASAIAQNISVILDNPQTYDLLAKAARKTVLERYAIDVVWSKQRVFLQDVIGNNVTLKQPISETV